MLKSRKLKIIIGALVVIGVLIASSIWVSMSLKTNAVDEFGYTKLADNNSATSTKTQIDYIIENANAANTSDKAGYDTSNYYITIIVPSAGDAANATASLNDFLVNGGFQKYIINDNRTIAATMPDGKIVLKIQTAAELGSVDAAETLSDADLIYVYAEKAAQYKDNPISEDLYESLRNFAFGKNKPLIMNYDLKNDGSKDDKTDPVVSTASKVFYMTTVDFKNSWKRTKTTKASAWTKDTTDVMGTLQAYMSSLRSTYSTYQLNNLTIPSGYASWSDYWMRTETSDPTLNVLYIYGDGTDKKSEIQNLADWMIGDGKTAVFGNSIESNIPTKAVAETAVAADLTPDSLYYTRGDGTKVKKYDYIFISPENYSAANDIKDEVRAGLNTISEATDTQTYIIFGTMEAQTSEPGGGSTTDPENLVIDTSTNFGKLVDLSITTTGYAKKNNVLVVGKAYMQTLAANPDKNPTKIAQIVTLINKSTYRSHSNGGGGTSGSTSTTAFRVLELQPCYPIDLELAMQSTISRQGSKYTGYDTKGNYYTVPANVLNTTEIDNYTDENGKVKTEYYQWDLSKAKLAYALNMPVDNIELVQMSTEEFITSKADAADSYDLIYIGGNKSALKPSTDYTRYPLWYIETNTYNSTAVFSMFAHTGEMAAVTGSLATNNPYNTTVMNGNDITLDRLNALKEYIDSGMPVVFSSEVWTAYEDAVANKYANRFIDPDSNMYKLLAYADEQKKAGAANILENWNNKVQSSNSELKEYWVMNQTTDGTDGQIQRIENPDGAFGTAAKVTVFTDTLSNDLYSLVYSADVASRPKYTITTNAIEYSDKDAATKLTDRNLTWTVELINPIEGHTYQGVLLRDKDDNAEYDLSSEVVGDPVTFTGGKADFAYSYPSSEFGAFSWKILVADVTNAEGKSILNPCPSRGYSAISAIARSEDQSKKEASILEIMPMKASQVGAQDGQDGHTLYLDSNYQQARGSKFLYSKAFNDNGTVNKNATYGYAPTPKSGGQIRNYYDTKDINFTEHGYNWQNDVYLGKYQTTLGLNRYDSDVDHEDWTYNYVDTIADDFDLSLDIMYMDDIEYYAEAVRKASDKDRARYAQYAEDAKAVYDAYNTSGTVEYKALNDAETTLRNALLTLQQGGSLTVTNTMKSDPNAPGTFTYTADKFNLYDLDGILDSREYFRFFYINSTMGGAGEWSFPPAYGFYNEFYKPYITENDKKIDAYRKYRHFSMLAYGPEEYLRNNYDVVVIGFYDDFGNKFTDFSTSACEDLKNFLDKNGSLLMTHDNMTKYGNDPSYSMNLTSTLKSYAGMERFGEITVAGGTDSSSLPKYVTTDSDKYFFSSLSSGKDGVDLSKNNTETGSAWNATVKKWLGQRSGDLGKIGYPGYTDAFVIYETNTALAMNYTFAEFQIQNQIKYNLSYGPLNITGTTKATQVNRGVVTTYPFYVVSDLRISPTHNQAYSLNLEDDQVTVWYTFAADSQSGTGTAGASSNDDYKTLKENSSLYAASPKDGMDSYFIYSIGNITYCGAGHAMVTGDKRDNNDERKLFLNVLVNMAKKSGKTIEKEKDIILYDPDGTTKAPGNVVKRDAESGYYMEASSGVTYPEFAFGMDMSPSDTVTDVKIFYDLDYNAANGAANDVYTESDSHILVPTTEDTIQKLNAGEVYKVNKVSAPALVTKHSYFDEYDGTYTYLVVQATVKDNMGTEHIITKRIKIKLTREMLNLT